MNNIAIGLIVSFAALLIMIFILAILPGCAAFSLPPMEVFYDKEIEEESVVFDNVQM
jgi:hypothetical protein